jgi:ABC-type lipoprotein export system ATPase subunit
MVNGLSLHTASPGTLAEFRRRHVGFVFQMFHLLPYLNVLQNVLAAAPPEQQGVAQQRAGELLARFGLGDRLDHRPAELSAGERQRVAIARALINRPELLLADEPTGNLDPASARDVLEIIAGFHREGGTVLLVTHASHAAVYAQRVFRLRQGEVVNAAEA